jgi:hypothetical protein
MTFLAFWLAFGQTGREGYARAQWGKLSAADKAAIRDRLTRPRSWAPDIWAGKWLECRVWEEAAPAAAPMNRPEQRRSRRGGRAVNGVPNMIPDLWPSRTKLWPEISMLIAAVKRAPGPPHFCRGPFPKALAPLLGLFFWNANACRMRTGTSIITELDVARQELANALRRIAVLGCGRRRYWRAGRHACEYFSVSLDATASARPGRFERISSLHPDRRESSVLHRHCVVIDVIVAVAKHHPNHLHPGRIARNHRLCEPIGAEVV